MGEDGGGESRIGLFMAKRITLQKERAGRRGRVHKEKRK